MKNNLAACWKHFSEQKNIKYRLWIFFTSRLFPISSVRFISTTASCVCLLTRSGRFLSKEHTSNSPTFIAERCERLEVGFLDVLSANFDRLSVSYNWCRLKCLLNRNTCFWAHYSQIFERTVCVQQKFRVYNLRLSVWSCNRSVWKFWLSVCEWKKHLALKLNGVCHWVLVLSIFCVC